MPDEIVLRPLTPLDRDQLYAAHDLAFHARASPVLRAQRDRLFELDRTVAAFEGELLVGTSGAHTQRLSIPGGELPCAGVTLITVRPTHRRRGLLRRMLAELLADAVRRREPVAALWASEGGIYGRFGFGPATWEADLAIAPGDAPRAPAGAAQAGAQTAIELRDPAGARALLAPLWDELRTQRGGIPSRSAVWWDERVLVEPDGEHAGARPTRLAIARDPTGTPRGYALYRARPGVGEVATVEVQELIAPDAVADGALWRYLCGLDLVDRVVAIRRPVDDPLVLRFDDVRRAQVQRIAEGLWVRLLDVPVALAARTWATTDAFTLALADAQLPANAGRWRLETVAGADARCTPTDREPDVVLDARELGAAYLGGTPLTRLADAGLVRELTPGALERLDAALHVPRAPWAPEQF